MQQPVMIRDFDRLTLSVHYASSSPDKKFNNGNNTTKANSVEENSVNSEDYEISSSSSTSDHHHDKIYRKPSQQQQHQQQHQQHYLNPSNESTISTANSSLVILDPQNGVTLRPKKQGYLGSSKVASVSTSRLSSIVVNRNSQDLSKFNNQISHTPLPLMVNQPPQISIPNFPPPSPPPQQNQNRQQEQQEQKQDLTVTDCDVRAIDACYRGNKTRVFVCGSLANLYTCPRAAVLNGQDTGQVDSWTLRLTGIPILLLDSGTTRSRRRRRIQIALVEKGTCFALWRDSIDSLSDYHSQSEAFHVMRLSRDHLAKVGLSFDCPGAAAEFMGCLERLGDDPENVALSGPNRGKKATGKARKLQRQRELEEVEAARRWRPPSKSEISQPCGFQHVVSVSKMDHEKYFSLQAFVDNNQKMKNSKSQLELSSREQQQQQHRFSAYNSCSELNSVVHI